MRDDAVLGRALPLDRGLGPHDGRVVTFDTALYQILSPVYRHYSLWLRDEGLVWLIGAMVCLLAAPWVQLSVSAGNGWSHKALQHYWLMPISCHFWDCKALLVTSLTRVSGAITSVQTFKSSPARAPHCHWQYNQAWIVSVVSWPITITRVSCNYTRVVLSYDLCQKNKKLSYRRQTQHSLHLRLALT